MDADAARYVEAQTRLQQQQQHNQGAVSAAHQQQQQQQNVTTQQGEQDVQALFQAGISWGSSPGFFPTSQLVLGGSSEALYETTSQQGGAYTPSYANSLVEGNDFSSAGDLLEALGADSYEGSGFGGEQPSTGQSNFTYDPDTADNYDSFAEPLLSSDGVFNAVPNSAPSSFAPINVARGNFQGNAFSAPPTSVPNLSQNDTLALLASNQAQLSYFQQVQAQFQQQQAAAAAAGNFASSHFTNPQPTSVSARNSSFGSEATHSPQIQAALQGLRNTSIDSNTASVASASEAEQIWMQSLGQRISLEETAEAHQQQQQQQQQQQRPFAPVFEEDESAAAASDRRVPSRSSFTGYNAGQEARAPTVPILNINDTAMDEARTSGQQQQGDVTMSSAADRARALSVGDVPSYEQQQQQQQQSWGQATSPGLSSGSSAHQPTTPSDFSNAPSLPSLSAHIAAAGKPNVSTGAGFEPPRQDSYDKIRKFLKLDVDMGFLSAPKSPLGGLGGNQMMESPTGTGMTAWRKRANSDIGPRSPVRQGSSGALFSVVAGGVTDKTPTAMTGGVDWAKETAKIREANMREAKMQAQLGSQWPGQAPLIVTPMQQDTTLNPHMLQHNPTHSSPLAPSRQQTLTQASVNATATGSGATASSSSSSAAGGMTSPGSGPVRSREYASSRATAAGMPYHIRTNSNSSGASAAARGSALGQMSASATPSPFAAWQTGAGGSSSAMAEGNLSALRRSQSARDPKRASHRRGAQSEDLSNMARAADPADYLARVTAPDGSLAPPSAGASAAGAYYAGVGAQRGNPYRVSHDRHPSWGSTTSGSSAGSDLPPTQHPSYAPLGAGNFSPESTRAGPPSDPASSAVSSPSFAPPSFAPNPFYPGPGSAGSPPAVAGSPNHTALYSQSAMPTYSGLETPSVAARAATGSSRSNVPPPRLPPDGQLPIIPTVTTAATQLASANRRTNAALHHCPIPGCTSSFTRKFNLNGHLRSHTGDKPFGCDECGKKFARHFDLSRHQRLHSGVKAHTCESCGKNFARIDALRRHVKSDTASAGCAAARVGAGTPTPAPEGSASPDAQENSPAQAHGDAKPPRFVGHAL